MKTFIDTGLIKAHVGESFMHRKNMKSQNIHYTIVGITGDYLLNEKGETLYSEPKYHCRYEYMGQTLYRNFSRTGVHQKLGL